MRKNLLTTAVGAALVVVGASAHAVDAKISGHVNRAIMYADDGKHTETHYVDNALSNSRFRFTGTEDIGSGIKAGINWEMQFTSNSSNSVTQAPTGTANTDDGRDVAGVLGERIQEVYFEGAFGRFTTGQGSGAADGNAEMDLSGTGYVVNGALAYLLGSSITFRTAAETSLNGSGPKLGNVIGDQDWGRYDRVQYNSPALGPVTVAVSRGNVGEADINEVGVRLSTDVAGGKLAAAIGYSKLDVDSVVDDVITTGGSVSWLAPFGLSVTGGYTQAEKDNNLSTERKGKWKLLQVGYKTGSHSTSLMYVMGEDQAAKEDEAKGIGLGYNFQATKGVQIYAGAQKYSLDRPGSAFEDITIATVGSRIFF